MPSPPSEVVYCLAALKLAAERWEVATGFSSKRSLEEDGVRFGAVGEALFWAVTLDEGLTTVPAPKSDAELIGGLRYARNRITHSLVTTTVEHPGLVFPMVVPTRVVHHRWRSAHEIPPPASGLGRSDAGERLSAYRAAWEGQVVGGTLSALVIHFETRLAAV